MVKQIVAPPFHEILLSNKWNELRIHRIKMTLKIVMLSEKSHSQKAAYRKSPSIRHSGKGKGTGTKSDPRFPGIRVKEGTDGLGT